MPWQTSINLQPYFFSEAEKTLAQHAKLTASTFLYPPGVAGLRLVNEAGEIVLLPFQGQQIWDAIFHGRTLTMKSMFDAPYPTDEYLHTYGGFLIHCGATAMGVPGAADSHPLHGELPNAPYQSAQLLIGEDERGTYMGLTGSFQYTVAFSHKYLARPVVKLYASSSRLSISMTIRNLKRSVMELMYLAHINFRPGWSTALPATPTTSACAAAFPRTSVHPPATGNFYRSWKLIPPTTTYWPRT